MQCLQKQNKWRLRYFESIVYCWKISSASLGPSVCMCVTYECERACIQLSVSESTNVHMCMQVHMDVWAWVSSLCAFGSTCASENRLHKGIASAGNHYMEYRVTTILAEYAILKKSKLRTILVSTVEEMEMNNFNKTLGIDKQRWNNSSLKA